MIDRDREDLPVFRSRITGSEKSNEDEEDEEKEDNGESV